MMQDILSKIGDMVRESDFEKEFVSMKVNNDPKRGLIVEVHSCHPPAPGMVRVGKPDVVKRRFSYFSGPVVDVEIFDADIGEWKPDAYWVLNAGPMSV